MWEIHPRFIDSFRSRYGGERGFEFMRKSIASYDDILAACLHIYCTKHVLYKGRTQVNPQRWALGNNVAARTQLGILLSDLAKRIWNYFNSPPTVSNNQANFDNFHNKLCNWFLVGLNAVRTIVHLPAATYGNAQKMINILFKYLICFDDYLHFADLFSYCHMPIDNYILGNFIDAGVPCVNIIPNEKQYDCSGVHQCWHEFDEKHYLDLLKNYRATVGLIKDPNLSYMGVEFSWFIRAPLPLKGVSVSPISEFYL